MQMNWGEYIRLAIQIAILVLGGITKTQVSSVQEKLQAVTVTMQQKQLSSPAEGLAEKGGEK
jgi:hypothetical protein